MRRHTLQVTVSCVLLAGCAALERSAASRPADPGVQIGDEAGARWSATTWESVSTRKHRSLLERARPKTITGEVVDVSCFLQLGKRGEAHVACGQKCVRNGQPIGVLTDGGDLYLVIPEEHHPRRDGQVSIKERFAELMAKRVRVSGMVSSYHDYHAVFVRTLPDEQ